MSTVTKKYLPTAWSALTVTSLASLASSATVGWQSAVIDDSGTNTTNADDYEFAIKLPMANTAPASPSQILVYLALAAYISSSWQFNDGGTTTLPSGTQGTYTIASPNNLVGPIILPYTTQNQTVNRDLRLSDFGLLFVPDGFSIIIVNNSGAAVGSSPTVNYRPLFLQNV